MTDLSPMLMFMLVIAIVVMAAKTRRLCRGRGNETFMEQFNALDAIGLLGVAEVSRGASEDKRGEEDKKRKSNDG